MMIEFNPVSYENIKVNRTTVMMMSDGDWETLMSQDNNVYFRNSKIAVKHMKGLWNFIKKIDGVEIGLIQWHSSWLVHEILFKLDQPQKVELIRQNCPNCNWSGLAADIIGLPLYWGATNPAEERQLAKRHFSRINCPRCNEPFQRIYAIWAISFEEVNKVSLS